MKANNVLNSFKSCLVDCNLDKMSRGLYEFFHLRCGFIAHTDKGGFTATYANPDDFLGFMENLQENITDDIKHSGLNADFTDNTDSFRYDYDFNIPKVKKQMLGMIDENKSKINQKCSEELLQQLRNGRDILDTRISRLEDKMKLEHQEDNTV